tara:strand:+ start:674 stop:1522 length:849 start_codon:yes stop_codon:yes gene_type:complete
MFYVPNYVEDLENNKIQNINNSLIETVQELVYNNQIVEYEDLETLIEGKEIFEGVIYPYSVKELLIQVQERFVSNQFIPLEQRVNYLNVIDELRTNIPEITNEPEVDNNEGGSFISLISVIFGGVLSAVGFYSFWTVNVDREINSIESYIQKRKSRLEKVFLVEGQFLDLLINKFGKENIKFAHNNYPVDYIINLPNKKEIALEIKYTETGMIPLRTITDLTVFSENKNISVVLLSNAKLTLNAKRKLNSFNKSNNEIFIKCIDINEIEDIETVINELSETT